MNHAADIAILRELVQQYLDVTRRPEMDERRDLWTRHNSLQPTRPLVLVNIGMWNVWCREVFGDDRMRCADPFYRGYERALRMWLLHAEFGDDCVFEPWITVGPARKLGWGNLWGLEFKSKPATVEGGAWQFDPTLATEEDADRLVTPHHEIDEAATAESWQRLGDAVGDLIEIDRFRGPACLGFMADSSTHLGRLRGLEQLMLDMYERPEWLHRVLAFMRDGILANQAEAEAAGDLSLTCGHNQATCYCRELEPPRANSGPRRRRDLWAFCAAQEYTSVSPAMHEEFLLQYQRPIMEAFGLSAYGCCEDLTRKIDMLRSVKNLRRIAVTPRADIAKSAEQIRGDYVLSWRPNPSDMVCCGFDEALIRRIIRHGLDVSRGCCVDITLKDIETVGGDVTRLHRWTAIVKDEIDALA